MGRPEDSRVKIPALVHFTRLGYTYMSLKDKTRGLDYDPDTNIFYALFVDAINRQYVMTSSFVGSWIYLYTTDWNKSSGNRDYRIQKEVIK